MGSSFLGIREPSYTLARQGSGFEQKCKPVMEKQKAWSHDMGTAENTRMRRVQTWSVMLLLVCFNKRIGFTKERTQKSLS